MMGRNYYLLLLLLLSRGVKTGKEKGQVSRGRTCMGAILPAGEHDSNMWKDNDGNDLL